MQFCHFSKKKFEQIFFLSNCNKQLVTPVNLTRKKINLTCLSLINYLISRIESALIKLKTAFHRSHLGHCTCLKNSTFICFSDHMSQKLQAALSITAFIPEKADEKQILQKYGQNSELKRR